MYDNGKKRKICKRGILQIPNKQESPVAWTQEAYHPPRSKYSLCEVPPTGAGGYLPWPEGVVHTLLPPPAIDRQVGTSRPHWQKGRYPPGLQEGRYPHQQEGRYPPPNQLGGRYLPGGRKVGTPHWQEGRYPPGLQDDRYPPPPHQVEGRHFPCSRKVGNPPPPPHPPSTGR